MTPRTGGTRRRRRTGDAAAATALLALLAAGCGSSSSAAPGSAGPDEAQLAAARSSAQAAEAAPTTIAQTVPLSRKPPTGKVIVFLQDPAAPSTEQFQGLVDAAQAVGWTAKSVKFNPVDLATFNAGLLQALSMDADYVFQSGVPESQLSQSTLAKYEEAGVPIIVTDTTPVPATETLLGDTGGRNSRTASADKLADWFVADSSGTGRAAIVNITTYPTLTLFADGFADRVAKTCSSCRTETLEQTFGDALDGTLTSNIISKLRADRSIKYAVFDNSGEIAGLDAALKAAGLTDVKVIGHSIDPTTVKSMESGQAATFMAYNFRYGGWRAMDIALRHSIGDPTDDADAQTPFQLMTKANVGQLGPDALFRAPADALEQFTRLWLVTDPS